MNFTYDFKRLNSKYLRHRSTNRKIWFLYSDLEYDIMTSKNMYMIRNIKNLKIVEKNYDGEKSKY